MGLLDHGLCLFSHLTVLLNGNSHGFIKPERGIRQGDPLSPFLFILCAEALVNSLNIPEATGRIQGIKLSPACPSVHHLLFADDSLLMCKANSMEATEILECLKNDGEASGQVINLQKSSIIFGAKVPDNIKEEVKNVLGIVQEGGEGSYLGLPECFSGSKRKLLSFIREILQGRLKGWFSKSLSQGGKEILLKSVALALPVFAMSCFKLPKDLCAKLTSAMIEFWWSNGTNKKKISWIAWQKLCKDKELGGLGFKDIEKFNQVLLAKQAWRVWKHHDSLLARILQHRYFPRSLFLECVPRAPRYRQDAIVDLTLTVDHLINPASKRWNETRVRQLFEEEDVSIVLNTRFNLRSGDSLVWGFSRSGFYDSKSGYKLLESIQELQSPTPQPLPPLEKKLWSDLWKTKTSPKLRHFLWRALSGALAVKERLRSRGINLDTTCPLCGLHQETICHLVKIKELDNLRGYVSLGYSRTYGKQGIASVLNREDSRQLPSTPKQLRNLPFGLSSFRKIRKNKVQPEYWIMSGLGKNLPWGS
ncbi:uncharacterized protein LOC106363756 [Brassica napus]|uniref:uncharacterized protein LOC106363756 n=1 Tax=Brassica napus TaxID=3708 RepID=UPI0006AB27AE|nr:uncharacterized protein LOC106363756 [Brassica napus]